VKSGHHCCPCQAPPPPVLVTTSPSARIIRQSSQPEASACCCSGCCCPLHSGTTPSAASLRQLREPGDGIAGIAADSLRINGGIRQFRQVSAAPPRRLPRVSVSVSHLAPSWRYARVFAMQEPPLACYLTWIRWLLESEEFSLLLRRGWQIISLRIIAVGE